MPLGLPDCARKGCRLPGLFKFEFVDDGRKLEAFLCPACFLDAPAFLEEVAALRTQDRLSEERPRLPAPPETG